MRAKTTCRVCGSHEDVRHGHCASCRLTHAHQPGEEAGTTSEDTARHRLTNQPWTAKSAFVGRKRRSPRT